MFQVVVQNDQDDLKVYEYEKYDDARLSYDQFVDHGLAKRERKVTLQYYGVYDTKTFSIPTPRYKCSKCGSTDLLQDAYVAVNDPTDVRIFDAIDCDSCGDKDISLEEV
jgi:hypothetical protein